MPLTKADFDRVRALRDKKHREASGLYVVEGPKVIGELLAAGTPFEAIYATAGWSPPIVTSASANKQLRHMRIWSIHSYKDDIFRTLERVQNV